MAQEHNPYYHLRRIRIVVLQPKLYAQGRNPWSLQALSHVQLWQHQSRKFACGHHPVPAPNLLGCSAQRGQRRQPCWLNPILRLGLLDWYLELGCRVLEQIRVQLYCALRKELRRRCEGYMEVSAACARDPETPKLTRAG